MQTLSKTLKPETIADLNINWNFNQIKYRYFADFWLNFRDKNPNLKSYKIVPGTYTFKYKFVFPHNLSEFSIKIGDNDSLLNLMYFIHNEIALILQNEKIHTVLLSRFHKIDDNSFEIEEEIPF
jgi:hypothetical protein